VHIFVATSFNQISYGLGAIKGIGELAVNNIVLARKSGEFKDLFDLCKRVDLHKVSRKTLEALIKSGSLDCFNLNRASLLNVLEPVLKAVSKLSVGAKKQLNLFDNFALEDFNVRFANNLCQEWEPQQLLITEKEAFGFYFSRHPLTAFEKELVNFGVSKFAEANINQKSQQFAGLIVFIRSLYTKKGDKMAFISLDDGFSRQEIIIFSDLYNENKELLKKDCLIIIEGEVSKDNYTGGFKIKCNKIMDLYGIRKKNAKNLTIILQENLNNNFNAQKLKQIIEIYPGDCPLTICYKNNGKLIKIKSNANLGIDPKEQLLNDLKKLPEIEDVIID
jgi:DNA polymerase III subunit alpha